MTGAIRMLRDVELVRQSASGSGLLPETSSEGCQFVLRLVKSCHSMEYDGSGIVRRGYEDKILDYSRTDVPCRWKSALLQISITSSRTSRVDHEISHLNSR